MSKEWHKGPPPSIGWWPASLVKNNRMLRWWDGKLWSLAVRDSRNAKIAAQGAKGRTPMRMQQHVEWQERPDSWPEASKT